VRLLAAGAHPRLAFRIGIAAIISSTKVCDLCGHITQYSTISLIDRFSRRPCAGLQ